MKTKKRKSQVARKNYLAKRAKRKTEEGILRKLGECWNEFLTMEQEHSLERHMFMEAIHNAQSVIAVRIARESNPKLFPRT